MVKTNRSTLHTVYDIQQSATQGSNDTTHRLSRRTAATTRFSTEGIGCQKQTAPRFSNTRSSGLLPRKHSPDGATSAHIQLDRLATHLLTPEGWKAELEYSVVDWPVADGLPT